MLHFNSFTDNQQTDIFVTNSFVWFNIKKYFRNTSHVHFWNLQMSTKMMKIKKLFHS